MEQRVQQCNAVFGPSAFFSHMHGATLESSGGGPPRRRRMLVFYRRTHVSQEAALEEAIGLLDRHPELQMTLKWRASGQRVYKIVFEIGQDSFDVSTAGDPPGTPFERHTHTRQELMHEVASAFLNAPVDGKAIQVACLRLRAVYEVTRDFQDDGRTISREDAYDALLYQPLDGDQEFFHLLQNVGPEGVRRVYALDTLNRLPVNADGKRQNPFTRQMFDMRDLRRGHLRQVE